MSTSSAEILVAGHVQGVGYRAWVERQAVRRGLVGVVMNLEDGRVRIQVEGERAVIEHLVQSVREGPRLARVDDVATRWMAPTGRFTGFRISAPDGVP